MTNTDYSAMSDFEINKRVAESIGIGSPDFNPCNYPSDAWSIIETKKISLVYVNNQWSARQYHAACIEVNGDSAFRCAMIVFLMMQDEGEKDGK